MLMLLSSCVVVDAAVHCGRNAVAVDEMWWLLLLLPWWLQLHWHWHACAVAACEQACRWRQQQCGVVLVSHAALQGAAWSAWHHQEQQVDHDEAGTLALDCLDHQACCRSLLTMAE